MTPANPGPLFLGSEIYRTSSYGGWHPLRIPRVSTVMDLCRAMGWLPADRYLTSPRARPAALTAWHTPDYVAALEQAEADQAVSGAVKERHALGTPSNPVFPEMYRRPATAAGASILAGELVANGGTVYSPASGTHHGMPDRASGFCYLNDPVLGLLSLRRMGLRRIAYIDIDAHHCDGVDHAFANDPDMLLISVHEDRRWPFTGKLGEMGAGNVFNIPVPRGFNDTEMRAVLDGVILPATAAFAPDAIMLQCGADAVCEDPLSRLDLSNNAHWQVVSALRPLTGRYIVTGGGGYNPWTVARLWSGVWATLAGAEIPERLPPKAEAILRDVKWSGNSRARSPRESLFTTLRDPPNEGPVREEIRAAVRHLSARLKDQERATVAARAR